MVGNHVSRFTFYRLLDYYRQNISIAQDQVFLITLLDLRAGILGEEDFVAFLQVDWNSAAALQQLTGANRDNDGFLGFFLCGVRQIDAALCLVPTLYGFDHYPVNEMTNVPF